MLSTHYKMLHGKLTIVNFNESGTTLLPQDNIWPGNTVRYVVISMGTIEPEDGDFTQRSTAEVPKLFHLAYPLRSFNTGRVPPTHNVKRHDGLLINYNLSS